MSKCTAIVLAAGKGKRMQSKTPKQYMLLDGKPVLYYSLKAMEDSIIDEIVLVTSGDEISYCRKEIVEKYQFKKVTAVVEGGVERYHSVFQGIRAANPCDYLFIHDGARPFLTQDILNSAYECVSKYNACVVAVPVKDTIKQVDDKGVVTKTLKREELYQIQTPQVFRFALIKEAYEKLIAKEEEVKQRGISITDDAMVLETMMSYQVRITEGSYTNIKITTPEDICLAESIIKLYF